MKLFLFFLFFFPLTNFAQNNTELDQSYANYFKLTREIPYLHLNKTSFIKGEELWLQAYVLNQQTKALHQHTSNLHINIYDSTGKFKSSKLLLIKNGLASANIKIDSTFTDKTYYVSAATNWMKNFEEDETFIQKITIIGNSRSNINNIQKGDFDLQVLPEGGHLVESTDAVVGIIIKDNKGNGVKIKTGVLLNNKSEIIKEFNTNVFGIAKLDFLYQPNTSYRIKIITQENKELIKDVPTAKKLGLTLNVNNPNSTFVNVVIKTNTETFSNTNNAPFHLYIHNTTSLIKSSFTLKKDTLSYNFYYSSKKLPKGVNIITVVDQHNTPILERVFFNYDKSLISSINPSILNKSNDSITLELNKTGNNGIHYLSATILPENTKSYELENTMFSKFLLAPFVKGNIENSSYYFKNTNRKKLADLDLLLLTQGWSKYKWYTIFNIEPKVNYEFEKGITIKGTVNSHTIKDSTDILLFAPKSSLILSTPIINNNFSFNNIFLNDNTDNIGFTIYGKKNLKAYTTFFPKINQNRIVVKPIFDSIFVIEENVEDYIGNRMLREVVITSKKKKTINKPRGIYGSSTSFKMSDGYYPKTQNIISFLRTQGFKITGDYPNERIETNRGPQSILSGNKPTSVFLDDQPVVDEFFNTLYLISNMNVEDFEEIVISKSFRGQIYLYSNKELISSTRSPFQKIDSPIGFASEKSYYVPRYYSTTDDFFKNYGTIYWKPNIVMDTDTYQFKIPNLSQENIKVYIEGIASDGSIIYEEKLLNIK